MFNLEAFFFPNGLFDGHEPISSTSKWNAPYTCGFQNIGDCFTNHMVFIHIVGRPTQGHEKLHQCSKRKETPLGWFLITKVGELGMEESCWQIHWTSIDHAYQWWVPSRNPQCLEWQC